MPYEGKVDARDCTRNSHPQLSNETASSWVTDRAVGHLLDYG